LFECLIEEPLGSGGYGDVYKIYNQHRNTLIYALKVISIPKNQNELNEMELHYKTSNISPAHQVNELVEKYTREVDTLDSLKDCTNIVHFLNYSVKQHPDGIGKDILIQMELLTDLTKFLQSSITIDEVIKVGMDMCIALEYLQKHNIIHRDIKPANILYSPKAEIFKLSDFGIAKVMENRSISSERGTPLYSAPEIYKMGILREGDMRSDIYSLGLVLYRMLNENLMPFVENPIKDNELALEKRLIGDKLPFPKRADEHPRLAEIIMKACEYKPEDRYSSAELMKAALQAITTTINITAPRVHQKKFILLPDYIINTEILTMREANTLIGEHITIPNDYTSIGDKAFYNRTDIKSITISNTCRVEIIGSRAFECCVNLTNIIVSNNVVNIGDSAFSWCGNLTNIVIPISVTEIGKKAFMYCSNLLNIIVPDSVTNIGQNAFYYCHNLTVACSKNSFAYDYCQKNKIKVKIL
jgi:serine/threonine protein kinase